MSSDTPPKRGKHLWLLMSCARDKPVCPPQGKRRGVERGDIAASPGPHVRRVGTAALFAGEWQLQHRTTRLWHAIPDPR